MKKRIVSLLLVFCMVFTLLPADVLADEVKSRAETVAGQAQTTGTTAARAGNPFADVKSGSWYEAAVLYARANGFFDGTSATTFEPDGPMTRAMFVTVLGRMAGVEAADYAGATDFIDVAEGTWYAPFVKWAARYGITTGTGNGKFSPDGRITREEMAVFFVRYFETFDAMPKADTTVTTKPADLDEVSAWAQDAVLKLWALGLLNGDGVNFAPKDKATRAQTAALCQRTDKAVETWYSEPGVKSERVSVEPGSAQESGDKKPEEQKPSGGGSSTGGGSTGGGSSSGGTTTTTYYEVSFAIGAQELEGEVTLPEKQLCPDGMKISELPTPTQQGSTFFGWYYDSALTQPVGAADTVKRHMTLYARMGTVAAVNANEAETPNYVTVTVPAANVSGYTFGIRGYAEGCIDSFINVTANNAEMKQTGDTAEPYRYTVSGTAVSPVLAQGQTYRVELKADSDARFVVDGAEQAPSVRVLNIVTEKDKTDNLKLADGVKLIPASSVRNMTGTALDGLFTASTQSGSVEQNKNIGTFSYTGADITVGDTVAIYSGMRPDLRTVDTSGTSADGAVAYVEITAVNGDTYNYKTADSKDVLFTPDVLPVSADADKVVGDGNILTVDEGAMVFTDDKYSAMGLGAQTTVDIGDYLALYTGTLNENGSGEGLSTVYGLITAVSFNEESGEYTIAYTPVEQSAVLTAMDLYSTRNEKVELSDEQKAEIEADMEYQAIESGFVEEASKYLTALAMETDGFRELSDDLDMDLSSYSITYADGTPVSGDDMELMAGKAQITEKKVEATIAAGKVLQHFDGSYGVRAELAIRFKIEVSGKLEIVVQAIFEQEVLISVNTSGGAIWKWAWIFPYIYDYQLNANIDLGTYTGIGITATAKTVSGDDDSGYDWKSVTGSSAENKIIEIGKQITELMEAREQFLGEDVEWNGTVGGSLAEKYAAMMEDAEDNWVELFRQEIFSKEGPVDKLHILVYGISADFVVSANVYVTLGMTFSYSVAKRYNFSLQLFHKQSTNETIDLEEANYNFDFYVMGTIGIRAGVEFEIGIGLFSLRLDSIGITAEAGAYARLWGYFYYHLSWTKSGGKDSNASGAMFVEIGLYLKITFKAQLFSSDKLTYQPTLYEAEWPLWSAGAQNNIYDFDYAADDKLANQEFYISQSFELPSELFSMKYMDMKTGETSAENYDDDTESRFYITLSNPRFTYNPSGNIMRLTEVVGPSDSCDVTITWKNDKLAFTSEPISRTIKVSWYNPSNSGYIHFNSNGGSNVPMLSALNGSDISDKWPADPVRPGYTFLGWFTNGGSSPYTNPGKMPTRANIYLYAHWRTNTDTPYKVEHYREDLNGDMKLYETENLKGTTNARLTASGCQKNYENFGLQYRADGKINGDGSTVYRVYYYRLSLPVTFDYGELSEKTGLSPIRWSSRYEDTTYPTFLSVSGYQFLGYVDDEGNSYTREALQNGFKVTRPVTFYAQWKADTDTPYRIEHYAPDANNHYALAAAEDLTGTTDAEIDFRSHLLTSDGLNFVRASVSGREINETNKALISGQEKTVVKIYYGRDQYTLTFDTQGGSSVSPIKQYGGLTITLPKPEREGYTFGGWYKDMTCSEGQEFTASTMPVQNMTLYAKWTAKQYTITFVTGEGSTEIAPISGDYDTAITKPADPARPGYTFLGWDRTIPSAMPAGDLTITARWQIKRVTITFNTDGGTAVTPITQNYGTAVTAPAVPSRTGYTFAGWSPALPESMPPENLTVTAMWAGNLYTVHFDASPAQAPADQQVRYGATYGTLPEPVREGYAFTGWYLNNRRVDVMTTVSTAEEHTLTARWTVKQYTITFDTDGGSAMSERKLDYGAHISVGTPTKAGYTFVGWLPALPNTMPAENLNVKAQWTPNASTGYVTQIWVQNVSDDDYSLAKTIPGSAATGTEVTAAESTDPGLTENAGHTDRRITGMVIGSGALVLRRYYDRNTYVLTFKDADGAGIGSTKVRYGAMLTPPELVKDGYTLNWNPALPQTMPAEDSTYQAEWVAGTGTAYKVEHYQQKADEDGYELTETDDCKGTTGALTAAQAKSYPGFAAAKPFEQTSISGRGDTVVKLYYDRLTYSLTLNAKGGTLSGSETQTLRYGQTLGLKTPERAGYAFTGWYTDEECSVRFDGTAMPNSALTLFAGWLLNAVNYTVEHYVMDVNGAYQLADTQRPAGGAGSQLDLTALRTKAVDGQFVYAKTEIDGTAVTEETAEIRENMAVKVYYDRVKYMVTFDADGGVLANGDSYPVSAEYYYGAPFAPEKTQKTGFEFMGWYDVIAGGKTYVMTGDIITGNTTLRADWAAEKVAFTVEHYVMDVDGNYKLDRSNEVSDYRAGETPEVSALQDGDLIVAGEDDTYGIAPAYATENGEADGTKAETVTVSAGKTVKLYYERGKYKLVWSVPAGIEDLKSGEESPLPDSQMVYYGATVSEPEIKLRGVTFNGWRSTEGICSFPFTMPAKAVALATDLTYLKQDVTIEHYVMDPDGNYALAKTETRCLTTRRTIELYEPMGFVDRDLCKKINSEGMITLKRLTIGEGDSMLTLSKATDTVSFFANYGMEKIKLYYDRKASTATFHYLDGSTRVIPYYYEGKIKPLDAPTGYSWHHAVFWQDKWDIRAEADFDTLSPNIYSDYDFMPVANNYTVYFDANGGSMRLKDTPEQISQRFTYDETKALYDVTNSGKFTYYFYKRGCTLAGWAIEPNGAVAYQPVQEVTSLTADKDGSVTLYAVWNPIEYKITYKYYDEKTKTEKELTGVEPSTYTAVDGVVYLTGKPENEWGREFKGWGLYSSYFLDGQSESFKAKQLVDSFDPTDPEKTLEDKTFYAWMNPVVYTISYDLGGGEWGEYAGLRKDYKATFLKNSYTEEEPLKLYNNQPSKARYRLKGWTADNPNVKFKSEVETGQSGGTSVSLSMLPGSIGNVTFTPIWEPRTFSITYWKNLSKHTYKMDAQYTSYTVDSEGFTLPDPVDEEMTTAGKTFQGWYATYNNGTGYENKVESIEPRNPDNIAGKPETGIIGLYAYWK